MENKIYDAFKEIKADSQIKEKTLEKIYEEAEKGHRIPIKRTALTACASLAFIFLISVFSYRLYFTESAYIDIDVNPSIELTINRFNRVIAAYAYNDEGNKILKGVKLTHKAYDEAIDGLMEVMEKEGYLRNDGLISATIRTDWREEVRLKSLEQAVENHLTESHKKASHEVYPVDSATKEEAYEENISPAKYLAILELQKIAPDVTVESCKEHSISEIKGEIYSHEQDTDNPKEERSNHGNKHSGHK